MGEVLKKEKRIIRFFKEQKRATEGENYGVIISLNIVAPKYSDILDSQKSQDFEKRSWNICCLKLQSSDPRFYFAYQLKSKMFALLERIKQSLMGIKLMLLYGIPQLEGPVSHIHLCLMICWHRSQQLQRQAPDFNFASLNSAASLVLWMVSGVAVTEECIHLEQNDGVNTKPPVPPVLPGFQNKVCEILSFPLPKSQGRTGDKAD